MTTDVTINDDKGYYDFDWTDAGDISTGQTLDTAILMSIFNEVRANEAEVQDSRKRRGWVGNESTEGFEQGSKQWLFEQERLTGTVLAELEIVVQNGSQWFIDDNIAIDVIAANTAIINGRATIEITYSRTGSEVEKKVFELWQNTGNF